MLPYNVRMSNALVECLTDAAAQQQRTTRGLIRHVLRSYLAQKGYLSYNDVIPPLLVVRGDDG